MTTDDNPPRIDRRTALQWITAATASLSVPSPAPAAPGPDAATGYGPDPDLIRIYQPGDLWPLTFSDAQRRLAIRLCDLILPADETSPSASSLGVHDFLDEWISSPYPGQARDRALLLKGLAGLDATAQERGAADFISLPPREQLAICQDLAVAARKHSKDYPGSFFLRLRDLVAGGYYTTPAGMKDLGYRGNVAMTEWNGPPPEVLEQLGLSSAE